MKDTCSSGELRSGEGKENSENWAYDFLKGNDLIKKLELVTPANELRAHSSQRQELVDTQLEGCMV